MPEITSGVGAVSRVVYIKGASVEHSLLGRGHGLEVWEENL